MTSSCIIPRIMTQLMTPNVSQFNYNLLSSIHLSSLCWEYGQLVQNWDTRQNKQPQNVWYKSYTIICVHLNLYWKHLIDEYLHTHQLWLQLKLHWNELFFFFKSWIIYFASDNTFIALIMCNFSYTKNIFWTTYFTNSLAVYHGYRNY